MGRFCPLNRQDNYWGERERERREGEEKSGRKKETENMSLTL